MGQRTQTTVFHTATFARATPSGWMMMIIIMKDRMYWKKSVSSSTQASSDSQTWSTWSRSREGDVQATERRAERWANSSGVHQTRETEARRECLPDQTSSVVRIARVFTCASGAAGSCGGWTYLRWPVCEGVACRTGRRVLRCGDSMRRVTNCVNTPVANSDENPVLHPAPVFKTQVPAPIVVKF